MNGLTTRNALHQYNVRHAGMMHEMDAIKRCDTVRMAKDAGIEFSPGDDCHMRVSKGLVVAVAIYPARRRAGSGRAAGGADAAGDVAVSE